MSFVKNVFLKELPALKAVLSLIWLSNLSSTDAYFSAYVILLCGSLYLRIKDSNLIYAEDTRRISACLSVFLSILVLLANYPIFTSIGDLAVISRSTSILMNMINSCFGFFGGIFVFYPLLQCFFSFQPQERKSYPNVFQWKYLPPAVFGSFLMINLIHLFFVEYPGNLTEDSFTQISEMISGVYSNFNTFWHTVLFQGILSVGYKIFPNVNAAVACFSVFQIVIMSLTFTYCLLTMRDLNCSVHFLVGTYLVYALMPYHIALSVTIWKDVLFAGACLLLLTSWLRILKGTGICKTVDYVVFLCASILFLMTRTIGWIIYLAAFAAFAVFTRHHRRLKIMMASLTILGWVMMNPALSVLQIPGGDRVESLSIPIQQVSRVIAEGCPLTEEEEALLAAVVDLEDVPELYTDWLSDPMKAAIRNKDLVYFEAHLPEYRDLWIRLGLRYPVQYLKAWVDQTKGYWNAGYPYAMYSETITDNPYGVYKGVGPNPVASIFRLYFGLSRHVILFEPFHSIGLHVWIVFLCLIANLLRKKEQFVIIIPLAVLVLGLCAGTPVYCSFRYVYPLFASFPLVLGMTIYSEKG